LDTPSVEEGVVADEEGVGPLAHKSCEGRIDLPAGTGVEDLDLQSHGAGSGFYGSQRRLGIRCMGRIDEHCNTSGYRHQRTQELQPLCGLNAGILARAQEAHSEPHSWFAFGCEGDVLTAIAERSGFDPKPNRARSELAPLGATGFGGSVRSQEDPAGPLIWVSRCSTPGRRQASCHTW
jgi:hypothetical protein